MNANSPAITVVRDYAAFLYQSLIMYTDIINCQQTTKIPHYLLIACVCPECPPGHIVKICK